MSPSPSNRGTSGFVYPDPSHYGLNAPRQQSQPRNSTLTLGSYPPAAPVPAIITAPAPPFPLDPALLAQGPAAIPTTALAPVPAPAPAPAPAPIVGPIPAARLSAAGLQPFPVLFPGLQAPIELTQAADIRLWDDKLLVAFDYSGMGLHNNLQDTNARSQVSRRCRARGTLKELWEKAGGERFVKQVHTAR